MISSVQAKWKERNDRILNIGDCLWYATEFNEGEKGLVKYCATDDSMTVYKYPSNVTPFRHCCCLLNDIIYIINGRNHGAIISFDLLTKVSK